MDDQNLTQVRRGILRFVILATLDSTPMYGLQLANSLPPLGGADVNTGTVYPLLARLRREGMVQSTWEPSSAGPPRRTYELTERGREAAADFRAFWPNFSAAVSKVVTQNGVTK